MFALCFCNRKSTTQPTGTAAATTTTTNDVNTNGGQVEVPFHSMGGGSEEGQPSDSTTPPPRTGSVGPNSNYEIESRPRQRSRTFSMLARFNRPRLTNEIAVDRPPEETRKDLISRLKSILTSIERGLNPNENDLEIQLQSSGYSLQRAASDYLERSGLRQIEPGCTLTRIRPEDNTQTTYNSWSLCQPTAFRVRAGPNYRKNKLKAQAKPFALYDVIAADMYSADRKVEHLSRFMKLGDLEAMSSPGATTFSSPPPPDGAAAPTTTTTDVVLPELFIINFMLPLTAPTMPGLFGPAAPADGPTVCFHFVMRLSQWTKENMDDRSVRLLATFLSNSGDSMRERLKIIVQIANPDELQMGRVERGLYRQYNSLPFLYRAYNSKYHVGNGWFQADFDGHRSGYATRAARFALLSFAERIVANVAFLIEAETDDELPERILGCCTVHRLKCNSATPFVKPVATSFSPSHSGGGGDMMMGEGPAYPTSQSLYATTTNNTNGRRVSNLSEMSKGDGMYGDALDE